MADNKAEEPKIEDAGKEDEMPELENQEGGGEHQFNRNEKKCRKALMKVGMKQLTGITRVTLKKRDGLIFVIDDPEVLNLDNSYAIFGELKLEDLNQQMQKQQAQKFAEQQPPAQTPQVQPRRRTTTRMRRPSTRMDSPPTTSPW